MSLPRRKNGRSPSPRSDRNGREVRQALPELFVRTVRNYTANYAQARIRVRKGCYQYLVWRDGDKTRELYLGKKETRPPQKFAGAGGRGDVDRARSRGTK